MQNMCKFLPFNSFGEKMIVRIHNHLGNLLTFFNGNVHCTLFVQGAPKKTNPVAKTRYLGQILIFLFDTFRVCRGGILTSNSKTSLRYVYFFKSCEYSTKNVKIAN